MTRRPLASIPLAALLVLGLLVPASAQPGAPVPPPAPSPGPGAGGPEQAAAEEALEDVTEILEGKAPGKAKHFTTALAELDESLEDLPADQREEAEDLLEPPETDSSGPGLQSAAEKRECDDRICVHYDHAGPDGLAEARQTLQVMNEVWDHHVDRYGYLPPRPDRGTAVKDIGVAPAAGADYEGTDQFDVVIKDLGGEDHGIYGYCQPFAATADQQRRHRSPTFCVLDDDFAEYPGKAEANRRVTAAHEFYHALQNSYDTREDAWLKEATATWMEEQFADEVNDNRQFLRFGQLRRPARPLDRGDGAMANYGNWVFFQFLTEKFGPEIPLRVWRQARGPHPARYSVNALHRVLRNRGGLADNYAHFAGVNTHPAAFYDEGAQWGPRAKIFRNRWVARAKRQAEARVPVRNLGSRTVAFRFNYDRMRGPRWKLVLGVIGQRNKPTGAHVMIHLRNGRVISRNVRLNANGNRKLGVRLRRGGVKRVTVTVSTATRRYRCGTGTPFACDGSPRPPRAVFTVRARVQR